jgi:N utilization substance protein A
MSNPLQQTIEALAKEKGIEPDVVISAIEEAVATASRKYYKTGENLKTRFNNDTGQVDLFALKTVVEEVTTPATEISINEAREMYRPLYGDEVANSIELGDEMEFPKPTEVLGRIAAQTAKQVIFQKVREAEREHVFAEYNDRIGEVVNSTIKRFENGDIILEIGRIEAVLPRKEQSRAESYTPGDRVRTVIKGVNRSAKGPQIVLSRTDPALLIKLFEQEVPEIYDGTVVIRGAVREAGDRAKVAVFSRERDVDPVGACVGMKGTRVQSVVQELRGEKIDIVPWTDDQAELVCRALAPAKVSKVVIDEDEHAMEVIVPDDQLSLAIGKRGQNVRLAHRLSGWKLDVRSDSEAEEEARAARASLNAIPGIGDINAELLYQWGFRSAEQLSEANEDNFEVEGISPERARQVILAARDWVESKRRLEEEKAAAAVAAAQAARETSEEAAGVEANGGEELGAVDAGAESTDEDVKHEATTSEAEVKSDAEVKS